MSIPQNNNLHRKINNLPWFRNKILKWYVSHGRHYSWRNKSATRYHQVIAEILLQRTKVDTVAAFLPVFMKEFPSWTVLSNVQEAKLRKFLKPIGLWRQRSAVIKNISVEMVRRNGKFPIKREEIEGLPGVGQYIANAIEVFCSNKRCPLLDVNMTRVLERYFGPRKLADIRYDPYLQKLAHDVLPRKKIKEFNWAILDFGALVCKARNPACNNCLLAKKCKFVKKKQELRKSK